MRCAAPALLVMTLLVGILWVEPGTVQAAEPPETPEARQAMDRERARREALERSKEARQRARERKARAEATLRRHKNECWGHGHHKVVSSSCWRVAEHLEAQGAKALARAYRKRACTLDEAQCDGPAHVTVGELEPPMPAPRPPVAAPAPGNRGERPVVRMPAVPPAGRPSWAPYPRPSGAARRPLRSVRGGGAPPHDDTQELCDRGFAYACRLSVHEVRTWSPGGKKTQAEANLLRGCKLGHAPSCHQLGMEYQEGRIRPPDELAAYRAFARACELGLELACDKARLWIASAPDSRRRER